MKAGIANLTVSPTPIAAISKSNVESRIGPKRQLVRCKDMSEVEFKADSKVNAEFGRGLFDLDQGVAGHAQFHSWA
jgi:hypothetical protein